MMRQCDANNFVEDPGIKWEHLKIIEENLDYYEKVSLIFLLYGYENPSVGYNKILALTKERKTTFLEEWVWNNANWENILREAITIIQNYAVINKIGLNHQNECLRFLPRHSGCTVYIHPVLKILYHLCEEANQQEVELIISEVQNTASSYERYTVIELLEIHILNWLKQGIMALGSWNANIPHASQIQNADFSKLLKPLKTKGLQKYYDLLIKTADQNLTNLNTYLLNNSSCDAVLSNTSLKLNTQSLNTLELYNLDVSNMGICLIIDEKEFNANGLQAAVSTKKLQTRYGTEVDRNRLREVFSSYGYKTIIKENLTNIEILQMIKKYANAIRDIDSSFVVCILSHGQEGAVFGSNGKTVEIKNINQMMRSKSMLAKPSILIIQACQTPPENSVSTEQRLTVDSHHMLQDAAMPEVSDFLICNSTVKGYASIRDKEKGSWFIQEFCDVLDRYGEETDLYELLLLVNKNIKQRTWTHEDKVGIMIPEFSCSFSKKFIMPNRHIKRK